MRNNGLNRIVMLTVFLTVAASGCHKQVASKPAVAQPPRPSSAAPSAVSASSPVSAAAAQPAKPAAPAPSLEQLFQQNVKDAFFDYDKSDLRSDARQALQEDADFLRSHPEVKLTMEGHCDERGSEEYNLGLGDRRATSAKRFLVASGIAEDRIQTTSYGKEHPFCEEHNESCWKQNRRGHAVMTP